MTTKSTTAFFICFDEFDHVEWNEFLSRFKVVLVFGGPIKFLKAAQSPIQIGNMRGLISLPFLH